MLGREEGREIEMPDLYRIRGLIPGTALHLSPGPSGQCSPQDPLAMNQIIKLIRFSIARNGPGAPKMPPST